MEHHDGDDGDGDDVDQSLDVSYPMFKQKQTNLFFLIPNYPVDFGLNTHWSHTHLGLPKADTTTKISIMCHCSKPAVPHKAVAEVSKIGRHRRGELLRCMGGRANTLMDRKVVGAVFFKMVAMVAEATSPTTAACSVV